MIQRLPLLHRSHNTQWNTKHQRNEHRRHRQNHRTQKCLKQHATHGLFALKRCAQIRELQPHLPFALIQGKTREVFQFLRSGVIHRNHRQIVQIINRLFVHRLIQTQFSHNGLFGFCIGALRSEQFLRIGQSLKQHKNEQHQSQQYRK